MPSNALHDAFRSGSASEQASLIQTHPELLGEEEPGLVELVMEKVGERPTKAAMVDALEPVLDAEAEAFAEKLWAVLPRGKG